MSAALLKRHWGMATFLMAFFYVGCQIVGYVWGDMVPGGSVGGLAEWLIERDANAGGDVVILSAFRFVPQEWMVYASRFIFDGLWPVMAAVWVFCCLRGTTAEGMTALLQFFSRAYYYIAMCFFAASFMLLDFDVFFADEENPATPALAISLMCWGIAVIYWGLAVVTIWLLGVKTFFDVWSDGVFLQVERKGGNFFFRKKRE